MKIVVYRLLNQDGWYIKLVSSSGVTAGKTCYESKKAAVLEATLRYPGVEIEYQD